MGEVTLKPCPFCGSSDVRLLNEGFIVCRDCTASCDRLDEWNRRVPDHEAIKELMQKLNSACNDKQDLNARIGRLQARVAELESVLRELSLIYDGNCCRHDHHGLCQNHHLRRNADGEPECEWELVREVLK